MKRYIADVDSYGFQGKYWTKGEALELPDDAKCPEYFKPAEEVPVEPTAAPEPNTYSGINKARDEGGVKTGMAFDATKAPVKPAEKLPEKPVEKAPAKPSVKPSKEEIV